MRLPPSSLDIVFTALKQFLISQPDEPETNPDEPETNPDDLKAKIADVENDITYLTDKKTDLDSKIASLENQLAELNASFPEFEQLLSESEFKIKLSNEFNDASAAYCSAVKKLNNDLMVVNKEIADKEKEITNMLILRNKPLPVDWNQYQVIRDLNAELDCIKARHQIPPSPAYIVSVRKYPDYYTYYSKWAVYFKETRLINNQLNVFREMLKMVNDALIEETWRPKYLIYAFTNKLDCDDENIFRKCNKHHMEKFLPSYWFDCNCDANYRRHSIISPPSGMGF
jgi:hypothetical protein